MNEQRQCFYCGRVGVRGLVTLDGERWLCGASLSCRRRRDVALRESMIRLLAVRRERETAAGRLFGV